MSISSNPLGGSTFHCYPTEITLEECLHYIDIKIAGKSLSNNNTVVLKAVTQICCRHIDDADLCWLCKQRQQWFIVGPFYLFFALFDFEMHRQLVERNEVFTKPGMVERFFPDLNEAHIVEAIRKVQAKSWALGDDENEANEIKKKVYENPQNYVLKTNECGTPNTRLFFNNNSPKMTPADHNYFYIMEKLRPMVVKNQFVRPKMGFTANLEVTPELGIYGCLIGNTVTGEVSYVSRFGHTMKTKTADEDEGGIMRGNSVADTPNLV
ncbi:hypothetical protein niasHT_033314 [Heterodera trifolii]|uniref:Glutathione synthetase n=1 Tax=Heterodera trifolii TaxID=157864 RepID=A0ABD2I498_9BILA